MKRLKSVSKCSDLMGSRDVVSAESDTASVSSSESIFYSVMDVGSDRGEIGVVSYIFNLSLRIMLKACYLDFVND